MKCIYILVKKKINNPKLFYFVVEFEYFAKIVLNLINCTCILSYRMIKKIRGILSC